MAEHLRYYGQEADEEGLAGFGFSAAAVGLTFISLKLNEFALAHHIPYLEAALKTGTLQFIEKAGVLGLAVTGIALIAASTGPHYDDEPPAGGHDSY